MVVRKQKIFKFNIVVPNTLTLVAFTILSKALIEIQNYFYRFILEMSNDPSMLYFRAK